MKPGQYFVLQFDFSGTNARVDPEKADQSLIKCLNSSIKTFYGTYAAYFDKDFTDLCQDIDSSEPSISLKECALTVQEAIKRDPSIRGIYVLVDEYDAFPNNYINAVGGIKFDWEDTQVSRTLKSFWGTLKSLATEGFIQRMFITGISPLSVSAFASSFNMTRNLSFHKDLAGLCGLTHEDVEDALMGIYKDPEACKDFLSEMRKSFNGYHFCYDEKVNSVYNTETCLAYLQCRIEKESPETRDPPNSEVSSQFLNKCAASASLLRDFEEALEYEENGDFKALENSGFRTAFTMDDLVC